VADDGLIAVLADVHGNRWALEAVLADARAAGARRFVDLGDCAMGPLDPRGSAERLMDLGAITVSGNGDREVAQDPALPAGAGATYAREQLTSEQLAWQAALVSDTERVPSPQHEQSSPSQTGAPTVGRSGRPRPDQRPSSFQTEASNSDASRLCRRLDAKPGRPMSTTTPCPSR
jgi:hypothetical protein